jgi:hypothetical protein
MDGNPVALVDVWGASTDGGEKGGAQKHADKYKTETGRSYSTDSSDGYVFEGVDVTPPAGMANPPANTSFVPMSTMVFNTFELQQDVMRFGDLTKPESGGKNGFEINGYTYTDDNGVGDSRNNFASDGTSDGVKDVSGIADVAGGHSQGLSKLLSFLHSVFWSVMESGILKEGDVGEKTPEVDVVTEAEIEGIIRDLNPPSPVPQRYMLNDSIRIDIVPQDDGSSDSVRTNEVTGDSELFKRFKSKKVWLETSKKAGDKHYGPGKIVN